jgi:hypothetical protein
MVGQPSDYAITQDTLDRVRSGLSRVLVDDYEDVLNRAANCVGLTPASQPFADRIELRNAALFIRNQDGISDTRECHSESLF